MSDMDICRADQGRCPTPDLCIEKCVRARVEEPIILSGKFPPTSDDVKKVWNAFLSTDSHERKDTPIYSGVMAYFPLALAEIAKLSKAGNDKHNPGQPLHRSRGKSNDHADCIARHLLEIGTRDPDDGHLHSTKLAWRALANLQIELEAMSGVGDFKKCEATGALYRTVIHNGAPSPTTGENHA